MGIRLFLSENKLLSICATSNAPQTNVNTSEHIKELMSGLAKTAVKKIAIVVNVQDQRVHETTMAGWRSEMPSEVND